MFFRSQRGALITAFLVVSLIPLCVLICYQTYTIQEDINRAHERQNVATEQIANEISSFVEMHRRGIEAAAHQVTQSQRRNRTDFDAILSALHHQFPGFINLYFANTQAKTLAFYPEFNAKGKSMVGTDFSSRWHYKQLQKELKTYISPVMKGVGGTEKLLCTIVAPFYDSKGGFEGFVLGALNLEKIAEIIADASLSEGTYAVVTDSLGQVIASPGWSSDQMPSSVALPESKNKTSLGHAVFFEHVSPVTNQKVVSSVVAIPDPSWQVWLSAPVSRDQSILRSWVWVSSLLVALTFLTVIVASFALSERLTQAIKILGRKVHLIEEHNYEMSSQVLVPKNTPQEVQVLDDAFNAMSASLKKAREDLLSTNAVLESRVKARTATLTQTLESMHEGFGLIGNDGVFSITNPVFRSFVGRSEWVTPLTRTEFVALVSAKGDVSQHCVASVLLDSKQKAVLQLKDGTVWELSSFGVSDGAQHFGRGVVLEDISERFRLDAMKNSLISVAAHEFKTPLAAIRMQSETLARTDVKWDEETRRELIDGLLDDVVRLEILVRDWLDISRIESGAILLHPTCVDLVALLDSVQKLVEGKAKITIEIDSSAHKVVVDANRMHQVLINLITNAIRYCDRYPEIRIKATVKNQELIITVEDNGIGIPKSSFEAIFEKFHQIDMSASRRSGGTGLGLTISRGLVRAHGGDLTVDSRVGFGSTFTILIPQKEA